MHNKVHKEKRPSCRKDRPTKRKEKNIGGISREWRVKLETRPDATWQERCQSLFVTWWEPCLGVSNNSDACDASSEKKIFGIAVGKRSESERTTTTESAVMAHSNLTAAWKCFYKGLCPFHLIVKWGRRKAKQPLPDHSLALALALSRIQGLTKDHKVGQEDTLGKREEG